MQSLVFNIWLQLDVCFFLRNGNPKSVSRLGSVCVCRTFRISEPHNRPDIIQSLGRLFWSPNTALFVCGLCFHPPPARSEAHLTWVAAHATMNNACAAPLSINPLSIFYFPFMSSAARWKASVLYRLGIPSSCKPWLGCLYKSRRCNWTDFAWPLRPLWPPLLGIPSVLLLCKMTNKSREDY